MSKPYTYLDAKALGEARKAVRQTLKEHPGMDFVLDDVLIGLQEGIDFINDVSTKSIDHQLVELLDEYFPKRESKERGQAMVFLARIVLLSGEGTKVTVRIK